MQLSSQSPGSSSLGACKDEASALKQRIESLTLNQEELNKVLAVVEQVEHNLKQSLEQQAIDEVLVLLLARVSAVIYKTLRLYGVERDDAVDEVVKRICAIALTAMELFKETVREGLLD